ncbi:MAG: hypothetical protein ACLRS8_16040 [Parabacteroides merdae]
MDALELKLSLIEQLKTIDDVKLLTQIKNLISIATEKKETLSGTDDAGRIKGSVEEIERRIQKRIRYDNGRIT